MKTKHQKRLGKADKLFDALVTHLTTELKSGTPDGTVIKEARQFLKDFAYLIEMDEATRRIKEARSAYDSRPNVVPFPVAHQGS